MYRRRLVNSTVLICLSLTEEELERLTNDGPRRDIVALGELLDAPILLRSTTGSRKGLLGKIFGPQMRHAWKAAGLAARPGTIFADGEHLGFPLALALLLRGRRDTRLIILGHLVDKRWKRAMLWVATRMVPQGTLILHSVTQSQRVKSDVGNGWQIATLPYQVDTEFWEPVTSNESRRPLIVSAGSENRDYQTLVNAARGLDVDVRIAAGSHWARESATANELPPNVEFIKETLPFSALRELYGRASAVVVPLFPSSNQAGVTTILEAMSMARPVVVSCTDGQREVVSGPLVRPESADAMPIPARGPRLFGLDAAPNNIPGLYVPPEDAAALRKAIVSLLDDRNRSREIGHAGRQTVVEYFGVDDFAGRFAAIILAEDTVVAQRSKAATRA